MRLLFLLLGLITGLWIGFSKDIPLLLCLVMLGILFFVFAIKKGEGKAFALTLIVGFCLSFFTYACANGKQELTGIVLKTGKNYFLFQSGLGRYYVYSKSHAYEVGDLLSIKGTVKEYVTTTYEGYSGFGDYLASLGVKKEISYPSLTSVFANPLRFRAMEKAFLAKLDKETASALDAILFNVKDSSSSTLSLAKSMNLLSILSASGMLFGAFTRLERKILSYCFKEKTKETVALVIELCFLPFGLRKVGVFRLILLSLLRYLNRYVWKQRFSYLELLSLSGLLLCLLDFHFGLSSAFLLGYLISLALYFSRGFLGRFSKAKQRILVLLFIRLLLLPLSFEGGKIHLFGLVLTQLAFPFVCLFALVGLFSYVLFPIPSLLNRLGEGYRNYLGLLSKMDATLTVPPLESWVYILFYLLCFVCLLFLEVGIPRKAVWLQLGFVSAILLSFVPVVPTFTYEVSFLNVGQGDSILIHSKEATVLLDTGGNTSFDMAREVLIPYLLRKRIYRIDALLISHQDADHCGAKDSLVSDFTVGQVVEEAEKFPFSIGGLNFLNYNTYGGEEENEASLVLGLDFLGKKWLFMGDAPKEIEKKIIADNPSLTCDILKVGHHGSSTSTCQEFLNQIKPSEAIVSVGARNSYGHPNKAVLERLKKQGITIRRTDEEGTITYRSLYPDHL